MILLFYHTTPSLAPPTTPPWSTNAAQRDINYPERPSTPTSLALLAAYFLAMVPKAKLRFELHSLQSRLSPSGLSWLGRQGEGVSGDRRPGWCVSCSRQWHILYHGRRGGQGEYHRGGRIGTRSLGIRRNLLGRFFCSGKKVSPVVSYFMICIYGEYRGET